jgi:hypothetical protein
MAVIYSILKIELVSDFLRHLSDPGRQANCAERKIRDFSGSLKLGYNANSAKYYE